MQRWFSNTQPGLADVVLAGSLSLNDAYVKVQEVKRQAERDRAMGGSLFQFAGAPKRLG
jgi:hypothetical protein